MYIGHFRGSDVTEEVVRCILGIGTCFYSLTNSLRAAVMPETFRRRIANLDQMLYSVVYDFVYVKELKICTQ